MLVLVPLWTGAVALFQIAFRSHAEVKVQALTCDTAFVMLAVTNTGERAGILGRSSLLVQMDGRPVGEPIPLHPIDEHAVVRPQEAFVLKLQPRVEGVASGLPMPADATRCRYQISTTVSGFDGSSHDEFVTCPCPSSSASR